MINRYDLKIKNNDYLIYCPTPFQMMTGTTICTQLDLYQAAFKQLHKLSPRYQTLCKKIFQNELNIEKKNAVQVFNTNRKKTPIKNLKMDSKTRYTILPALLKCFSTLQDFIPKNNYTLLEIHVMALRYIVENKGRFIKTSNPCVACIAGTELQPIFNIDIFHRDQYFGYVHKHIFVDNHT
jgi:mRNA-degrading endonuclease RelE of RelBE toxin-antitoxin system